ncbi:MAG: DUF4147 domain-containing protein [Marinibacterium sp.]|nr:DUF4147 domain-containing protein [Marinibacterium sp.]
MSAGAETGADLVTALWQAGVAAVDGYGATARAISGMDRPDRILAVGKAATAMARAAAARWPDVLMMIVTKDGHGTAAPPHARLIEAAHPVPDARSLSAGAALRAAVMGMPAGSDLLLLVSGGASSLAEDLHAGFGLDDMVALNQRLLAQGLDITAMNRERRRLSRIKGGGLLSGFAGARATTLAISDVPGDDPGTIGSGIGIAPPDRGFAHDHRIIASNAIARAAAVATAQAHGLHVIANDECLHRDLPLVAADLAARIATMPPGVMILGGEPTVTLPPTPGQGGRNQALALSLARHIAGRDDVTILVAGTDGSDGPTTAAGGRVTGRTWGDGAAEALARADSGPYLAARDALFVTGPTGTNVMDLAIILRA